jgi:hypothetical protein
MYRSASIVSALPKAAVMLTGGLTVMGTAIPNAPAKEADVAT